MIEVIICILFLTILFWFRSTIRSGVDLYFAYKYLIDPDETRGHMYTMFKLGALIVNLCVCVTQMLIGSYRMGNAKYQVNEKFLKITFRSDGNDYFYLAKVPQGTDPVKQILNEVGDDVTSEILPYISNDDGITTPADFGYQRVTVRTVFAHDVVFEENELMCLTYFSS